MSKHQQINEAKADDAYNILNELMGELHAVRTMYSFVSDEFLNSPKVKDLKEAMGESTRVYIRRIAIGAFASVMYKYVETYNEYLKPIGCATNAARALRRNVPAERLD